MWLFSASSKKSASEPKAAAYDVNIRMLMVGNSGAGKSSLLYRFVDDSFVASVLTTIGIEFRIKNINIDGKRVRLLVFDTAGTQRHQTDPAGEYRGVQAVIVVYDITDRLSFRSVRMWMEEVEQHAIPNANKLLVGTKCDRQDRVLEEEEGRALAEERGYRFTEASAKRGDGVAAAFTTLAQETLQRLLKEHGKK